MMLLFNGNRSPARVTNSQVRKFVHSAVEARVEAIYEHIEEFIIRLGPIIEDVQLRLKKLHATAYGDIHQEGMEREWRLDIASTKKGIDDYKTTLGFIDHNILEMDPTYSLRAFLAENTIPSTLYSEFEREVSGYWQDTYAPIFNKLQHLRALIQKLHDELEIQIRLLERFKATDYLNGFTLAKEVEEHFQEERKTFHLLVKEICINKERVGKLLGLVQEKKKRLAAILKAQQKMLKENLQNNEGEIDRALVALHVLIFVAGMTSLFLSLGKTLGKVGLQKFVVPRMAKKLEKMNQTLVAESEDYLSDNITKAIQTMLRALS